MVGIYIGGEMRVNCLHDAFPTLTIIKSLLRFYFFDPLIYFYIDCVMADPIKLLNIVEVLFHLASLKQKETQQGFVELSQTEGTS